MPESKSSTAVILLWVIVLAFVLLAALRACEREGKSDRATTAAAGVRGCGE